MNKATKELPHPRQFFCCHQIHKLIREILLNKNNSY